MKLSVVSLHLAVVGGVLRLVVVVVVVVVVRLCAAVGPAAGTGVGRRAPTYCSRSLDSRDSAADYSSKSRVHSIHVAHDIPDSIPSLPIQALCHRPLLGGRR